MVARQNATMTLTAPAKVNLNLHITGRRDDGYHLLESLVVFTKFGDQLLFQKAETDKIDLSGSFATSLDHDDDNICLKALRLFREAGGKLVPVHIQLEKQIPVGAGLGGGSSDAAAVLHYANAMASTPLPQHVLHDIALQLGADVPVCLLGRAAIMRGIGEELSLLNPAPQGHILLARPNVMLSTPAVFKAFAASNRPFSRPATQTVDLEHPLTGGNDLQDAAISLCPEIGDLLEALTRLADRGGDGQSVVRMSGSGSACFAIFQQAQECQAAAAQLTGQGYWAIATTF